MCSIFGVLLAAGMPVPIDWRTALAGAMHHRGPDHHGVFEEPGLLLGSDRLAIIDTAGGNQPMSSPDGRYVIVYNGEVYNHLELRRDLEGRGHTFHTHADTETVLRAFEAYGPDCVERLNGMFAFAVWDRTQKRLFLARDRLGIKPLYLCEVGNGIAFASEAKALLGVVPGGPRVEWTTISRFFTLGYIPAGESAFAGLTKFPAGHHGWINGRESRLVVRTTEFWRPEFGGGPLVAEDHAAERIDALLNDAVGRELMSDVPLGLFLSGGLDSSAVAYYGARRAGHPMMSFALRFEEPTHDESGDARTVARHLGLDHHELTLTPALMQEGLRKVADNLDEPFGDSTVLPLRVLSEFARQHVKVVLTGWGGDEIFAGYPTLTAHRAARIYRCLPKVLSRRIIPALIERLPVSDRYLSLEFKAKRFVRGLDLPPELQHFLWMGYFDESAKQRLFRPEVRAQMQDAALAPIAASVAGLTEKTLIDRIMHLDAAYFLEGNGLFQADRMTMAASLEARVPLLNKDLLAYVLPLPGRLKMAGGKPKGLLKRVLRPHLPAAVIDKPKKGFAPPSSLWTRGVFGRLLDRVFAEGRVQEQGIFEPAEIRQLLHEHRAKIRDHGRNLWALLSFQLWHDRYISRTSGLNI